MKILILFLFMMLFIKTSYSQIDSTFQRSWEIRNNFDSLTIVNSQRISLIESDIKNIKFCSEKYHKQMVGSYFLFGVGTAIICSPLVMDNKSIKTQNTVIAVGSVIELIGLINTIDALKWIKYASIGENGVTLKFNL